MALTINKLLEKGEAITSDFSKIKDETRIIINKKLKTKESRRKLLISFM